jgi:hypothetical protein
MNISFHGQSELFLEIYIYNVCDISRHNYSIVKIELEWLMFGVKHHVFFPVEPQLPFKIFSYFTIVRNL